MNTINQVNTRQTKLSGSSQKFALTALTAAIAMVVAGDTFAQQSSNAAPAGAWEEIVITSRNRQEVAQDVPLPIMVLGAVDLEREDITTLWDLPFKVPNLQLNNPNENAR